MSYILEALKKSQIERELGQVPDLTSETFADSSEHKSSISPWIIGSVVMALLALLVALYAVFGRQLSVPETPRVTAQEPVPEQPAPIAAEIPPVQNPGKASIAHDPPHPARVTVKPAPATVTPEPATPVAATEKKAELPAPVKKPPVASSGDKPADRQSELERIRREYARMQAEEKQLARKPEPSKPHQQAPTVPAATAGLSTTNPAAPVTAEYPSVHELPADILTRMPPRNIILQSYSDNPEQSFVILNSVKLHQGQGTTNGLQVLEIRMDGLVLEFEGYKFFQPR